jgi:integrase
MFLRYPSPFLLVHFQKGVTLPTAYVSAPIQQARFCVPKLLPLGSPDNKTVPLFQACLDLIDRLTGITKVFCTAMLFTGARPQELLNLCIKDIDQNGFVFIQACKRGRDRIVFCPCLLTLIPKAPYDPQSKIFRKYTYSQFYRSLAGMLRCKGEISAVHIKFSRMFRSAYAQQHLALSAGNYPVVSQSLGHKSQRSTHFYTA